MKIKAIIFVTTILLFVFILSPQQQNNYNLVIISVDTLRADRLGCYGSKIAKTPNIDKLAKDGVLFRNAFTTSPLTLPSHASIMSGTYPTTHGIKDNLGYEFDGETIPTIASILKNYGYQTSAVVSSAPLNGDYGLRHGFKEYFDVSNIMVDDNKMFVAERDAMTSVNIANKCLEEMAQNKNPFFLWLHLFDPHAEYKPPQKFAEMFLHPYDGEIAYSDYCLGLFFQKLQELNKEKETIIVFVADHGESLGEHQELSHGYFVYNSTTHVPFIIKAPNVRAKHVSFPVRTIDIMPTVLSLLDVKSYKHSKEAVSYCEGINLSPYINSYEEIDAKPDLFCYSETHYPYNVFGWRVIKSLVRGNYKYINTRQGELYNIQLDPQETINLLVNPKPEEQEIATILKKNLERIKDKSVNKKKFNANDPNEAFLRGIDYLKGNKPKISGEDGPDTADMMHIVAKITTVQTQMLLGNFDKCEDILQSIISEDKNNIMAWMLLGKLYNKMSRYDDAYKAFVTMENLCSISPFARNGQIDSLIQGNKIEDAERFINKTLEENLYQDAFLYSRQAYIFLNKQKYDAAKTAAEKAIALDPKLPSPPFYLARALHEQKEYNDAIKKYQEAIKLQQVYPEAYYYLGICFLDIGKDKECKMYLTKASEQAHPQLKQQIEELLQTLK